MTAPMQRWRRLLFWAIVLQIAAVTTFLSFLLLGEHSRLSLICLYLPRHPLLLASVVGFALAPLTHRRVRALMMTESVLSLIVLFPVMGFHVGTGGSVERPVTVATYNVFFGKGGRPALLDEIAQMPADIILIQEAFASLGEKLRERLPAAKNVRQDGEFLILSRFTIRSVEVPGPLADGTPPMFVKYVIETPHGPLRVVNMHAFSPRHALFDNTETSTNIAQRDAQVAGAVMAARSDVPPFILAGDTNLPALSAIARRHFDGLTDAFAEVGLGFGYTFPAKRRWMRIDRVLGSRDIRFAAAHVGPRGTSDHLPFFVSLEMP